MRLQIYLYGDEHPLNYVIVDNVRIISVWKPRCIKEDEELAEWEVKPNIIYVLDKQPVGTKNIIMEGHYTNGEHFLLCFNTRMVIFNDDGKRIDMITANMPHELK